MKVPCPCPIGAHNYSAADMVRLIKMYQDGELHSVSQGESANSIVINPLCLLGKLTRERDL
jgi:hypothetical protein